MTCFKYVEDKFFFFFPFQSIQEKIWLEGEKKVKVKKDTQTNISTW